MMNVEYTENEHTFSATTKVYVSRYERQNTIFYDREFDRYRYCQLLDCITTSLSTEVFSFS